MYLTSNNEFDTIIITIIIVINIIFKIAHMDVIATVLMILTCILVILFIVALIFVLKVIQDIRTTLSSVRHAARVMDNGVVNAIATLFKIVKKEK